MTLQEWLKSEKLTPAAFADHIGETRQLIDNWLKRKHRPTLGKALKVRIATAGAVDVDDWLPRRARKSKPKA